MFIIMWLRIETSLTRLLIVKELVNEVGKTTKVLEITGMSLVYERLETIQQQLILCEKALAEYLETKRLAFPRFYFVSSADLLDILSNGNSPTAVSSEIFVKFVHLISSFWPSNVNR
jgi:Dynein heavy chain, N-terminal region 2